MAAIDGFPKGPTHWLGSLAFLAIAILILNTVANHVPAFASIEQGF